ncbi:cupin domain-containing protein [Methanobrevibacter sp. TMH8]|uniref:helix-turn-helix domain-containing protein n=1 Tax=Methanobrevibacter sp. TMH8 TaxID=2848611 RepID=UPI001CCC8F8B|nr:cupin domain-containing protein [Methanobrevibacter sp. TMH8]MBZ9571297.1 cupin domain-containing protein [Methanobrevibacter sp. TMH8]
MKETIKDIGARVKELRELSDFTTKEMAEECKISEIEYIEYENGEKDIPASVLYEIAHKFKVDMGLLLTGEETRMHIFNVTRKGDGVSVERRKQYKYENLGEKFIHKKGETFIVTVEPKDIDKPSTNTHPGQEFNYILEGSLKLFIHNNELVLNEGDSIFFDSTYEHAMKALNNKPAKFLAVIL